MKRNDIVILTNLTQEYKDKNLYKNVSGIIIELISYNKVLVLFLNDKIVGDYAVVEVDLIDIKQAEIKLPLEFIMELNNTKKLSEENLLKKQFFKKLEFNECDVVELLVEDKKYSSNGIHKGSIGVVAIDYAVGNSILVDFSGVDENGNYYGDCISVNIDDLRLIK